MSTQEIRNSINTPGARSVLFLAVAGVIPAVSVAQTTDADLPSGEQVLETVVVTGNRMARASALSRKENASNLIDAIVADELGKLPDRNLADALSRVPGVSVQNALGEGQFVSIRGLSPELNQVTVNGQTSAISDVDARAGRAGPLDVVGAADFASIEVTKTLTPAMDAQGLGGQINVNTPSALDVGRSFGFVQTDVGRGNTNEQDDYGMTGGWGDLYAGERLGVYIGGSWSRREFQAERVEGEWDDLDDGTFVPVYQEPKRIIEEHERQSVSANIEYDLDGGNRLYTQFVYNEVMQDGRRDEANWEFDVDNVVLTSPTSGTATDMEFGTKTRTQIAERDILNWTSGADLVYGRWRIEPRITYSEASEDRSPLLFTEFDAADGIDVAFDFSDWLHRYELPNITPGDMEFDKIRFDFPSNQSEEIVVPALDIAYEHDLNELFDQQASLTTRFGAKMTSRDRKVEESSNRYESIDPLFMDGFAQTAPPRSQGITFGPMEDPVLLEDYFHANRDEFRFQEVSSLTNGVEDDYAASEDILAGYVYSELQLERLRVLGGLRFERTDFDVSANQILEADGEFQGIEETGREHDYSNLFTNLQLRYELTPDLIGRLAFTQSIGRPDFVAAAPITQLEFEEVDAGVFVGAVSEGNPELDPFEADNIDLSLEWYFSEGGLLSASVFRKNIDNPIFERRLFLNDVVRDGREYRTLRVDRTENAGEAELNGIELAYQQQFGFLPGFWSGFGVAANATFMDSEVEVFDRDDELPFFSQPDTLRGFQVFYERDRVEARLAWQFTDENLRSLGGNPDDDIWNGERETVDAKITLQALENLFVFLEGKNLTEEHLQQYQGIRSRLAEDEQHGRVFRAGVSWRF